MGVGQNTGTLVNTSQPFQKDSSIYREIFLAPSPKKVALAHLVVYPTHKSHSKLPAFFHSAGVVDLEQRMAGRSVGEEFLGTNGLEKRQVFLEIRDVLLNRFLSVSLLPMVFVR